MASNQISLPSGDALRQILDEFKAKIEAGVLPPDPAEVIDYLLSIGAALEHVIPVPPLIEYIQVNVVDPFAASLPKLPLTATFPKEEWLKYTKVEGFRV